VKSVPPAGMASIGGFNTRFLKRLVQAGPNPRQSPAQRVAEENIPFVPMCGLPTAVELRLEQPGIASRNASFTFTLENSGAGIFGKKVT